MYVDFLTQRGLLIRRSITMNGRGLKSHAYNKCACACKEGGAKCYTHAYVPCASPHTGTREGS